jgi:hypothetical protein
MEQSGMFELPAEHFGRVMPLFDEAQPNSTMIFSTLARRTLGRAFVDHVEHPANCLLVMDFQHFSFTHDSVDPVWLYESVAALRQQFGFLLNWSPQMAETIAPPPDFARVYEGHEFLEYTPQGDLHVPSNRQVRRIDGALLQRCEWRDGMLSAFGSVENFLANGAGVCVMDGEAICSEAYAVFLGAGKFEIGIVTNERYRKQGNAYLACKALLETIEPLGYPPYWSYFGNNVGSAATAIKLGFGAQRDYQWLHYPQVG